MSKEARKAAEERFYLDRFLRHAPEIRETRHGRPGDEPDFVCTTGSSGTVGIELTKIHVDEGLSGSPLRRAERRREELADLFESRIQGSSLRPLFVGLGWAHLDLIPPGRTESLIAGLFALVQSAASTGERELNVTIDDPRKMPPEVRHLTVSKSDQLLVVPSSAGEIGFWDPTQVQSRISEKNAKAEKYKGHFSILWLCLLAESAGHSSVGDFEHARAATYRTCFDRTIIYDNGDDAIHELRADGELGPG